MNETEDRLSLDQIRRSLRRHRLLLLQVVVAGAAAGLLVAMFATERYEDTATVLVERGSGETNETGSISADAAARLVRTRGVAERVSREVDGAPGPDALLGAVSARADDSGFVTVTATDPSSERATAIANAFASQFIAVRSDAVAKRLQQTIAAGERQLAELPPTSRERAGLRSELAELRATGVLRGIEAEVIDPAAGAQLQREFDPITSAIVGAALGLLLGLVLAFARTALDPRVRSLREISQLLPAPQLAAMATPSRRSRRRSAAPVLAVDPGPLGHLRSGLLVFGGERNLERLVVTSPADPDEGKATVSASLALALARMGLRVCVVDADVRNPQLGYQFGMDAARGGLVEVLRGMPLAEASYRFQIPGERSDNGAALNEPVEVTVVPCAAPAPDAAELLVGPRLEEILGELGREHDVVLVDAPPILAAGETLPLAGAASGTILVLRHSRTTRRAAIRSASIVAEANGTLVGVVATGVPNAELRAEGSAPWPASAGTPVHGG